jgi:prepilin-type N-terminal cleavage/methylation domain-containing protein
MQSRRGFTLVEVLVVLALMVGLAALVAPGILGQIDRARVDSSVESLTTMANAIHTPGQGSSSFRGHVGVYPGQLSHLTSQITTGEANSCGTLYTATDSGNWRGPYLNRIVPPAGLPLSAGTASDTLVRVPAINGSRPVLKVLVRGVTLDDARAIDTRHDGTVSDTLGGVRWGAADAEGFVTLEYVMPVRGC